MNTVKYIGPDCDDLEHGVHLIVTASDGDILTCQDESANEFRLNVRFTRQITWECICPACYVSRGKSYPHPVSVKFDPETPPLPPVEPVERPRYVNRIQLVPMQLAQTSVARRQARLFE